MSTQFGRWSFEEEPVSASFIGQVETALSPYAPEGLTIERNGLLTFAFGPFHTSDESAPKRQPFVSSQGNWLMWDGRLDNREQCIQILGIEDSKLSDVEIVARAYERRETESFALLVGDWAVSIWNPRSCCLILATDFLGTRRLYYSVDQKSVLWSTLLDPLLHFSDCPSAICEEYLAGWLSSYPQESLTPFKNLRAVPAGHQVTIRTGSIVTRQFWRFDPDRRPPCRNDRDFEEAFLVEFRKSIVRRLRSSTPVLAELSGGVDSSSIVCTADHLCSQGITNQRLDTVSYFNDAEPNWDERPFVTAVERQRGRQGNHIDIGSPAILVDSGRSRFAATPSYADSQSSFSQDLARCIASGPYRVVLSGIGGDEVTGGVPTPIPELADYLSSLRLFRFVRRLGEWSLAKRKPIIHLLFQTLSAFGPVRPNIDMPWLCPEFVRLNHAALAGYPKRVTLRGGPPSFQANMAALDGLRRQIACGPPTIAPVFERRFSFLDRDFLTFCYSVPREQFVRPFQRRSLLRRAMKGIVPEEILNRKRKAFVVRQLIAALSETRDSLAKDRKEFLCGAYRIAEFGAFIEALDAACRGEDVPLIPLVRTIALENWLRSINSQSLFASALSRRFSVRDQFTEDRTNGILGREQSTMKGGD